MGAGIIRVAKVKAPQLGGLQHHIDRESPNHSNPDIDVSRSGKNKTWVARGDYEDFVAQRIAEGRTSTRAVRKDAVVLVDGIVTLPEEDYKRLGDKQTAQYLQDAREFVIREFGQENLAYYTIHLDETVPHAHWGAVPLKDGSLSWKNYFGSKYALSAFQDRFFEQVSSKYGLGRGHKRQPGENARRHKDMAEMKKETEKELAKVEGEIAEANRQRDAAVKEMSRMLSEAEEWKKTLAAMEEDYEALEADYVKMRRTYGQQAERLEHLQRYAEGVGGRVKELQSVVADVREFESAPKSRKGAILDCIAGKCDEVRNGMAAAREGVERRIYRIADIVGQLRTQLRERRRVPDGMDISDRAPQRNRSLRDTIDHARQSAQAYNQAYTNRSITPGRGR